MWRRFIPGLRRPATHNVPGNGEAQRRRLSWWRYGSGVRRARLILPAVTRSATSVPTGSHDASHWPNSNAIPNSARPDEHH